MRFGIQRAARAAAVLLPFALAACQSLLKPGAPCESGDGCPPSVCDPKVLTRPTMHAAASDLDHLEKHIDWHGSVTAKVPDVWGQARLTLYREQFEAQMVKELDQFKDSLQGSTARSDQAFALSSTALSAALGASVAGAPPAPLQVGITTTGMGSSQTQSPDDLAAKFFTSNTTATFAPNDFKLVGATGAPQISLEPTEYLNQKQRFLNLLAQFRRNNEGDDTADAPGCELELMRIPVSLLPGKRTDAGYGAEITMTLTPVLGDDLLPTTFRKLVINDVVHQLSLPITQVLSERDETFKALITPQVKSVVETVTLISDYLVARDLSAAQMVLARLKPGEWNFLTSVLEEDDLKVLSAIKSGPSAPVGVPLKATREGIKLDNLLQTSNPTEPSGRASAALNARGIDSKNVSLNRGLSAGLTPIVPFSPQTDSRTALPTSQIVDVYGIAYSFEIALGARQAFEPTIQRQGYAHLPDVQGYLKEELNAAYELLSDPHNHILWDFCRPALVNLIRTQNLNQLDEMRRNFRAAVAALAGSRQDNRNRPDPIQLSRTAAFAWAILVDAALLTDKLCKEMKSGAAARGGCIPGAADWMPVYLPAPPLDVCQTFNQFVRVRWPIHVFALDPDVQEQNLADRLITRRETQLALSMAFVSGKVNFNQLSRFARRLEAEYETVDLNRTQVAFGNGPNVFGWRFYPRFQTPDTPGNFTLITRDLIAGGPNKNQLLRQRRLEPGPRECVALVIMPSFVPAVQLDTTSNFFGLANPKHKVFDHTDAVRLGRTVQAIKSTALTDANCYRDGDATRLVKRAEQLESRLPMQTVTFPVPTEDVLGGFQLFGTSTTTLAPELYGFYGAPGVASTKPTTLFLVGNHFSPLRTRVIVGNKEVSKDKPVKVTLLSRQVVQVDFGPDLIPLHGSHVTVHVATPYGVSRELLVPVINVVQPDGYYLANESKLDIGYTTAPDTTSGKLTATFGSITSAPEPVVIRGQFASGIALPQLKLEIIGVSGTPVTVATDATGVYHVNSGDLQPLVKAWFNQFVAKPFDTTAEFESRLTAGIEFQVTPTTPTNGITKKVHGILRVTACKQTAATGAGAVLVPANPANPASPVTYKLSAGATVGITYVLDKTGNVTDFTVDSVNAAVQAVVPSGAAAAKSVTVNIDGGTGVAISLDSGSSTTYTMKKDIFQAAIKDWLRKSIKSGVAPPTDLPTKIPLQITPATPAGASATSSTYDITISQTKSSTPSPIPSIFGLTGQ